MTIRALEIKSGIMIDDTENLLTRLKSGDNAAFRLVFERYHPAILRFLYGMTGERDLADELAQETFMGAYKNIHLLRDEAKLLTWLFGIAKNVAYNALRTRRMTITTIEIDEQTLQVFQESTPDRELLNNELNRIIHDALIKLDNDKRLVFTLKVLQQMSYSEISEITGFSISKIKTDLHRARTEMRRLIHPYLEKSDEM